MLYIADLLIRSHLALLVLVLILVVVEKLTGLYLVVEPFLEEKKDKDDEDGNAVLFSFLYFLYLLIFLFFEVFIKGGTAPSYYFLKWMIISIPLTIIFFKVYSRFQGKAAGKQSNTSSK